MANRSVQPFCTVYGRVIVGYIHYIGTTWRIRLKFCILGPLANTIMNSCFLWPTRVHNPNGKPIGLAVSAQLTAESPYTLQWATLSPKTFPFSWGIWTPISSWFLGPFRDYNPKWHLDRLCRFCTDDRRVSLPILYNGTPFAPTKLPLPLGIWNPSNTWFLGPPESLTQTAARSLHPFLQGSLVWQTDRRTTLLGR